MTPKTKRLHLDTDTPAYKAVANELRSAIKKRMYPEGERLPTEDELVDRYQLSRQTIRRAFQELSNDGLIFRIRKRGTFAVPGAEAPFLRTFGSVEDMINLPQAAEVEIVEALRKGQVGAEVAKRFVGTEEVWALSIRQFDKGKPILFSQISVPKDIAQVLLLEPALRTVGHRGHFSVIGLIDKLWTDGVRGVTQTISPHVADKKLASLLGCAVGEAVLTTDRQYYDGHNITVEFARTFFHPQRYVLKTVMRR